MPRYFDRSRYYGAPPPPPEGWSYRAEVVANYRRTPPRQHLLRLLFGVAASFLPLALGGVLLGWSGGTVAVLAVVVISVHVLGWWTAWRWSRAAPPD